MNCTHCGRFHTRTIRSLPARPFSAFCSKYCYDHHKRDAATRARVLAAIALRPRCIICDAPINYGKPGVRYDSTTCGGTCAIRRWGWYGPANARARHREYHRVIARESMRRKRAAA